MHMMTNMQSHQYTKITWLCRCIFIIRGKSPKIFQPAQIPKLNSILCCGLKVQTYHCRHEKLGCHIIHFLWKENLPPGSNHSLKMKWRLQPPYAPQSLQRLTAHCQWWFRLITSKKEISRLIRNLYKWIRTWLFTSQILLIPLDVPVPRMRPSGWKAADVYPSAVPDVFSTCKDETAQVRSKILSRTDIKSKRQRHKHIWFLYVLWSETRSVPEWDINLKRGHRSTKCYQEKQWQRSYWLHGL